MDSALEGDPDICCIGTGNVTGCKAFCKDPHKSKLVQQINQEFAIMHTCAAKDFCSLQPCSDSCIQDPSGYSCQCRPGYFLDADNSSCVNHCDGVFCQINTKCVPTNIPPKYFKCVCDAGHTGDFCEIEKSMCLPNPCLHGSCVSGGLNGFTCICQPDYIGDLCEEEVLDCSRYPCRHEGTCVAEDSEKGFRCECKDGYNGDVCEKASDACTFVQCSNGGRCQIVNGSPMCVCATDFNDTKCEMSNTPCQPNPCNHGGTCEQDGRQFSCICPPGFKKGGRCEEDIDECLRDKLANTTTCAGNATCENTIGSFICQCPAGYALPDCLTPIDLCSSSPCLNGATCNPVPLSYTCTCAPGYVGQHCDIKGADRCTVTASEVRIIAGRYVTYVLQCASLGDKARFYFNMGDRFYFDATEPVYTPAASDAIRARTRIEVTLQTPSERYLYYYKHWFNGPGDYALTVQVYNGEFPTAKYITVVHVDPYPDICFPTVSIINGGWNISSGPPFHRSQYFVIQSSVTKPFFNTKCKQYIFVYEWTMYKLTVDHPIPELTEDWTGPRKSNEVTHDDAIKDIKKNDKFMAFPANTFMYGLYMDMLKVTATSNETIQSFTDAAENFTDISPFITTIVTNIQDLMANLTLAMADVEKEAESPNPTEDLVFASQMLNDSLKSMNESVANLTDIQALLPNASAALTEAANAKVDSVKPNRIVTTKAPLPPDPNSTIPIVPPKSTAEIATDALKLVERMAVVVNTTIKAIDNASMAIATVMTLMGAVPPSIKTAELNVSRAMHQFDRHLWNMTDKLDTVRRGKTAIDSDLINVDRGWFNITATPIKLEIKGGTKRIVSKTDSIVLDASNPQFSWDPDDSTPAENQTLTWVLLVWYASRWRLSGTILPTASHIG
ncbi:hypothetical protein RvY_01691-1 [Ramazzottius varieornatus]|uniref:EGF-like domain-containing protein n=1 Tax=Ramazzottius varieornatus TaxID=947166 RepID=A0A1D1USD6_RAMVA|nr:hypothetical protein RvY_01691-1 [Ramazzottius varieornatus]